MQSELAGGVWEWRGNDKSGRLWINPCERWSKWRQDETGLSDTGSKIIQVEEVKHIFHRKAAIVKPLDFVPHALPLVNHPIILQFIKGEFMRLLVTKLAA